MASKVNSSPNIIVPLILDKNISSPLPVVQSITATAAQTVLQALGKRISIVPKVGEVRSVSLSVTKEEDNNLKFKVDVIKIDDKKYQILSDTEKSFQIKDGDTGAPISEIADGCFFSEATHLRDVLKTVLQEYKQLLDGEINLQKSLINRNEAGYIGVGRDSIPKSISQLEDVLAELEKITPSEKVLRAVSAKKSVYLKTAAKCDKVAQWVLKSQKAIGDQVDKGFAAVDQPGWSQWCYRASWIILLPLILRTVTSVSALSDANGVVRNLLDALTLFNVVINNCAKVISCLRILQGCLSILSGLIKFCKACKELKNAKDEVAIAVAKKDMLDGIVNMLIGILWIAVGSLVLASGESLGITILLGLLFYGGFSADAILGAISAYKKHQDLTKLFKPFKEIFESKDYSDNIKKQLYISYFQKISKGKAMKKRAKRVFGKDLFKFIKQFKTENFVRKIREESTKGDFSPAFDAKIDEIQEVVCKTGSDLQFTIVLSMACLLGNIIGFPADLIAWGVCSKAISLDSKSWGKIGDLWWIIINFLYLFLDETKYLGGKVTDWFSGLMNRTFPGNRKEFLGQLDQKFKKLTQQIEEEEKKIAELFLELPNLVDM